MANTGNLVETGYNFTGWNLASDGSGTTYAPAQTFAMGSANVTLYAKWTLKWAGTKELGVAGADTEATGVAVDANGNVYVTGYTYGGLDGNTLSGAGSNDFFLTMYDSSGNKVRTKQLGVAGASDYCQRCCRGCERQCVRGRLHKRRAGRKHPHGH